MNTEILNKYIELINKGYCDDCNELNCLCNFPHKEIAKNIKAILEENQELKNQQKEFIEYLENEIMEIRAKWGNALSNVSQLDVAMTVKAYEDILSKYKEIIGGDNNE